LWDTTLCRLVYIFTDLSKDCASSVSSQDSPPFVYSSERNLEKFLCMDSQTIMGTGSEPGTVRTLVQVIITAPRHSYIVLPHKTTCCFSLIGALLSFTCINQALKSHDKQCAYKCYIEVRSRNHFCCGNAINIT
jgi:hypothetical protein